MAGEVLLTWSRLSIETCIELMAASGPSLAEDLDLIWAAGFARSLYRITHDQLKLYLSCILQYFYRISCIQDFFPSDDALDASATSKAVNSLASLLIGRAVVDTCFAQALFWKLKILSQEISKGKESAFRDNSFARLLGMLLHRLQKVSKKALAVTSRLGPRSIRVHAASLQARAIFHKNVRSLL